jgi:anti-sigma B factor antagonist
MGTDERTEIQTETDSHETLAQKGVLTVRSGRRGATYLIEVRGELDLATTPLLEEELAKAQSDDAEEILIDLSELEFISSTGLRVLLEAATHAANDSTRLQIRNPTRQVERTLRIAGVFDRLPIVQ